jgi:DNA-binding NarL/FixJ family response regulator
MTKKTKIRVMIVEDQGLVRTLFERWLDTMPRYALAGSARSGEAALLLLEKERPDVAMVDLQLPGMDGLEFIRAARQFRPQLRALVVSSLTDPIALTRVHEAAVEGYIEKDASPENLAEALNAVADGECHYSQKFRDTLATERAKTEGVGKILSRREQQVLELVLLGKTNREAGEVFGVGVRTIEFHRANIMQKLGARNLNELRALAHMRGWC